jgi:hypothetical protein
MNSTSSACLAILAFTLPAAAWSACNCGPTYCLDDSAFNAAIAVKKSKASADGAPARLLQLYDKLDHCVAAVSTAPDGFSILFKNPSDGSIRVDSWTVENEQNDATAVAGGKGACFVILARRALACCDATPATERTDYDSTLDLNTSDAIQCQP